MSGFTQNGTYQLTPTKALYWHRSRTDCPCTTVEQIVRTHLIPTGFTVVGPHTALTGPGIDTRNDTPLYEAVSGRQSHRR
jgi:hypothetical protein